MKGKTFTGILYHEVDTEFNRQYNWCLENLGPATDYPPRWEPGELGHPLKFRFRDSKDKIMFILRWGS